MGVQYWIDVTDGKNGPSVIPPKVLDSSFEEEEAVEAWSKFADGFNEPVGCDYYFYLFCKSDNGESQIRVESRSHQP